MLYPVPPCSGEESASYLYLLISQDYPNLYKVGVTDSLAARLFSLRNAFGQFDLAASYLVRAASRREAELMERTLHYLYGCALNWRAKAPRPAPTKGQSNGHEEWYYLRALTPMLGSIAHAIEHCEKRDRLILSRGVPTLETTPLHGATREERRLLRRQRREQLARELLAKSDAGFRSIQTWFASHTAQMLTASRPQMDDRGVLRRHFNFRRLGTEGEENSPWKNGQNEWDDLWVPSLLWCCTQDGVQLGHSYLDGITPSECGRSYTVGFAFGKVFRWAPERFSPNTDLPFRIQEWVTGL